MTDIDNTPWYQIGQQLHDLQSQVQQTLAAMQADPGLAAAIGRDVTKIQSDLGEQISNYQQIYTLLTGSPDSGLSGVLIPAAIVAGIIAIATAVAIISNNWKLVRQAELAYQAKSTVLNQAGDVLKQANAAAATGNAALAAQLYAQYQQMVNAANPGGGGSLMDFLTQNGLYIALGLVAFAAVKH